MKNLFPGHFKESEMQLREAWDTSLFVFDANILLNLYRYSDPTRKEFLRILEKIEDRVWLPHRAAEEYFNNRLSVIGKQEKSYDETTKSITSLRSDLENARQHPFVNSATMDRASKIFDELCEELNKNKSVHTVRIANDEIKDSIASIFEDRVGSPFSKEELEKLILDGESRYKQKIPPGYKDASKFGNTEIFVEKCGKYGDLIVWRQVINKALESGKGIVLVTDDKKEDWWERFSGKTVGPRPELVKEFKEVANKTFHMYQADRFLELARENLDEQVSDEVVEEVREVTRQDQLDAFRVMQLELRQRNDAKKRRLYEALELDNNEQKIIKSKQKQKHYILEQRMYELEATLNDIQEQKDRLQLDGLRSSEYASLTQKYIVVSEQHAEIVNRLRNSSKKLGMSQKLIELEPESANQAK